MVGPDYQAGVELGGTKTLVSLGANGVIIDQIRFPTTSPAETLARAYAQVVEWGSQRNIAALGIASFGPLQLDRKVPGYGSMLPTPKTGWTGSDILAALSKGFDFPCRIDTDVNGAALAEYRWGAAQNEAAVWYITVGTGLGGGLVLDGEIVHGAMHPEIGHIRVRRAHSDEFEGVCPFHGDCIEGLVSGPALAKRFGMPIEKIGDDDRRWDNVAHDLAEMVGTILLTTAATRVLFGGTVIVRRSFLIAQIRRHVLSLLGGYLPFVTEESIVEIVKPAGLGEAAGPLGSLALADSIANACPKSRHGDGSPPPRRGL